MLEKITIKKRIYMIKKFLNDLKFKCYCKLLKSLHPTNTEIGLDFYNDDEWKKPSNNHAAWQFDHAVCDLDSNHKYAFSPPVILDYHKLAKEFLNKHNIRKGKLLEVGGSIARNTKSEFSNFDYTNLDLLDSKDVPTIVGDITDCKKIIKDNTYDFIFNFHVFEHIKEPWKAAEEINRILKPGGISMTVTFWSWRYHPIPTDYWRFSPECLKFLFKSMKTLAYDFDTSCRRTTRQGEWPNKADSVPVDFRGGWLESWMTYHIGLKKNK